MVSVETKIRHAESTPICARRRSESINPPGVQSNEFRAAPAPPRFIKCPLREPRTSTNVTRKYNPHFKKDNEIRRSRFAPFQLKSERFCIPQFEHAIQH